MLTAERLRELLTYDPATGVFTWRTPLRVTGRTRAGHRKPNGYIRLGIDRRSYAAARVAWLYMTGRWPADDVDIDHVNSIRDDNRWVNLRPLPRSLNVRNARKRSNNTSGRTGVWFCERTGCWVAEMRLRTERIRITKHFTQFDDAVAARRAAELAHGFSLHHGRP